jgi:hypothetical protein
MPADLTSTGLLAAVRRNASLGTPNANAFPADSDLLAWLNEEMSNDVVPFLMRPREEYFVEHYEFTTTDGEAEYRIPSASTWDDVRDVQAKQGGTQYLSLPRIQPEEIPAFNANGTAGQWPVAYYLRGQYVGLVPTPGDDALVRIKYFRRPGYIVEASSYSLVSALTGASSPYTATVVSTTGLAGVTEFEFASSTAPFDTILTGITGSVVNGTTLSLTLTAAQAATLTDSLSSCYALAAGDAPGPQIPQDLVSYLEQRATYRALVAKKDLDGAKIQHQSCELTKGAILKAWLQRTDGLNRKVVGRSFNRRNGWGNWGTT